MPKKPKQLPLSDLILDKRLECRASRDPAVVDEYVAAFKAGGLPPITVYEVDGQYLVTDGWTRVQAARQAGYETIACQILAGTLDDAAKAAFESNRGHGQRLTNADKRRIVANALALWPKLSSREIAKRCGVSHNFVEDTRGNPQVSSDDTSTRTGSDGKSYPAKTYAKRPPQDDIDLDDDTPSEAAEDREEQVGEPDLDEPGDDHEDDAPESSGLTDHTDGEGGMDAPLCPEAVEACRKAERAIAEALAVIVAFEATPASAWLPRVSGRSQVRLALEKVKGDVFACRPSEACPCGKGCAECRQTGWLPKYMTTKNARSARE